MKLVTEHDEIVEWLEDLKLLDFGQIGSKSLSEQSKALMRKINQGYTLENKNSMPYHTMKIVKWLSTMSMEATSITES